MEQVQEVLDGDAEAIVKDIGIPPCPAILTKLMQEMRNDEPDFQKIGKLIGGDASLAAGMLKTVNSPFYGLRTKTSSVPQAIALLGLTNVTQLATGLLLRGGYSGGSSKLMNEYWESSSAIAQISASLARELGTVNRDEAFTFALFRDCGMLAMMGKFKDYRPVFPGAKKSAEGSITGSEDARHAMNHARVGCLMAKTWLLPEETSQAVLWHHDYASIQDGSAGIPDASSKYVALALVAEFLYVQETIGAVSVEWSNGAEFALSTLSVSQDDLDGVLERVKQDSALF